MRVLGIETSCDETAAAVVEHDGRVLSEVVHTQIAVHAPYGGVVPELASRDHLRNVAPVVASALERAGLRPSDIDGVAVTARPGLSGALLVGVQFAQAFAWAANKPVVAVDHLVGHLLAVYLDRPGTPRPEPPELPFIALLVSGGHTALYRVDGFDVGSITELGATRDDAAGEAFDKVAKLLGLGYPGGPIVDRLALKGDPRAVPVAPPMPGRMSLEFSFSGIKTSVARWVETNGIPQTEQGLADLCASFQRRVVDVLVQRAIHAARQERLSCIVLGGGVAANRELRERATAEGNKREIRVVVPPFASCTDNGAMIAFAGAQRLLRGESEPLGMDTHPSTSLPRTTRKGRGRRE